MNYLKKLLVYEKHRILLNVVLIVSYFIGMLIYDYIDEEAILDEPMGTGFILLMLLFSFNTLYIGSFVAAFFISESNLYTHKKAIRIIYLMNASLIVLIPLLTFL